MSNVTYFHSCMQHILYILYPTSNIYRICIVSYIYYILNTVPCVFVFESLIYHQICKKVCSSSFCVFWTRKGQHYDCNNQITNLFGYYNTSEKYFWTFGLVSCIVQFFDVHVHGSSLGFGFGKEGVEKVNAGDERLFR